MPRPRKTGPRFINGTYCVQVYDGSKRKTLSLQTTDHHQACLRYEAGHRALLRRIREEHKASAASAEGRWTPGVIASLREEYQQQPDQDPRDFAALITGKPEQDHETGLMLDRATERLAEFLYGYVSWDELADNAEKRRKFKTGKPYSASWWKNYRVTSKQIPFSPDQATVEAIGDWIDVETERGINPATIQNRCSLLQGLIKTAKQSGFKRELQNNFLLVDYSTTQSNSYYCPKQADYQWAFKRMQQERESIQVAWQVLMFTGVRVNALTYLSSMEEPGWLTLPDEDGLKGGGRVPMPLDLWHQAKRINPPNRQDLTKILRETGIERFKNHSWRSGFKQLTRDVGLDSVLGEALMCHSLGKLEAVYGDGFSDERLLEGAEKVWRRIEEWSICS